MFFVLILLIDFTYKPNILYYCLTIYELILCMVNSNSNQIDISSLCNMLLNITIYLYLTKIYFSYLVFNN